MMSVPIRTNGELRPSRLFSSMGGYVKRSMIVIIRAYIMYKPLRFFTCVGSVPFVIGFIIGIRFLTFIAMGDASGHVQSLILAAVLLMMGFMTYIVGLLADTVAANRKILEDSQYHARRADYDRYIKNSKRS